MVLAPTLALLPGRQYHWNMTVPETITCVECSGTAHRVGYLPPDSPPEEGDVLAYLCEECGHRHDVVLEDPADGEQPS